MKGQAVFEFVIASMLLFSIVIYAISYLSSSFAIHHDISREANLEAKAMKVADILTGGSELGIFSVWPDLDKAKMADLDTDCSGDGYFDITGRFGLNESFPVSRYNRLQITVVGNDGTRYVLCGRTPVLSVPSGYVTRVGYVPGDSQLAVINVTVW